MIQEAAIRKNGIIYTGKRHHLILNSAKPAGFLRDGEQGFVTETGQFVSREEAAEIAFLCGQILTRKTMLFSEDLY